MPKLRAALWDCNGTWFNDEYAYELCARIAFKELCDVYMSREDYLRCFFGKATSFADTQFFLEEKEYFNPEIIPRIFALEDALYVEMLRTGQITLRDGVLEMFHALKDYGCLQAVATGAQRAHLELLWELYDLPEVDATVTSNNVLFPKPHGETFRQAASLLGVPPQNAVAFDDSVVGVSAAASTGACTIGVIDSIFSDTLYVEALHNAGALHVGTFTDMDLDDIHGAFDAHREKFLCKITGADQLSRHLERQIVFN